MDARPPLQTPVSHSDALYTLCYVCTLLASLAQVLPCDLMCMQLSDSQGEVGTLQEQLMDITALRDKERAELLKMKVWASLQGFVNRANKFDHPVAHQTFPCCLVVCVLVYKTSSFWCVTHSSCCVAPASWCVTPSSWCVTHSS